MRRVKVPFLRVLAFCFALGVFSASGAYAFDGTAEGRITLGAPKAASRTGLMFSLGERIRGFLDGGVDFRSSIILILAAFAYGILHALGPGHQKTLVSGYLIAEGGSVRDAVAIAGTAALSHAVSLIGLFAALTLLGLGLGTVNMQLANLWVSRVSSLALAILSAIMLTRRIRSLLRGGREESPESCACGHDHGAGCDCVPAKNNRGSRISLIVSGSIAPCPGAAAFLLLAFRLGHPWAGIAAVLSISLGMWITLIAVALAALYARRGSLAASGRRSSRRFLNLYGILGVAGSAMVFAFAVLSFLP